MTDVKAVAFHEAGHAVVALASQRRECLRRRRSIIERRVRSNRVVVPAPLLDDDLRLLEAIEDFAVQQLITKCTVEGFTVTVLDG